MGPGGAGRRYLGAEDVGWSVPGDEDRGDRRRGAHPLPCSPNLLAFGCRLRVEVAETCGGARRRRRPAVVGWLCPRTSVGSRGAAALTCTAAALCWATGSRVAKAVRPGPRLSCRLPGDAGGVFGPGPWRNLGRGSSATWRPVTCWDGMDPPWVCGAGHRARGARTAAASSSAGRWRPGHSSDGWGSVSSRRG